MLISPLREEELLSRTTASSPSSVDVDKVSLELRLPCESIHINEPCLFFTPTPQYTDRL